MSEKRKIRIGQIGALHDHAHDIIRTFKKMPDVYELVGVAVPEDEVMKHPEDYEGVTVFKSPEDMMENGRLDAVAIECSEINLPKYVIMAAEHKLPVHMDKPGGISVIEFEEMIRRVRKAGIIFHTGYMYRYNPEVQKLKEDIECGRLGHIYSIEAHMDCGHKPSKRQWLGQFPGGMMFFLGCHLIDMICYLQGFPEEVIPFNCSTGTDGVTAEDCGFAVLKYKNGVSFAKTSANELGGFMRRQLVVCGEKGTVSLLPFEAPGNIEKNPFARCTGVRSCLDRDGGWFYDGDFRMSEDYDRYIPMMDAFAAYVRGEKENPFTLDYELNIYHTLMKACDAKL